MISRLSSTGSITCSGSLFLSSLDPPISAQAPGDFLDWTYDLLTASFELDFDVAEVYQWTVTSEAHHAGALACMLLDRLGLEPGSPKLRIMATWGRAARLVSRS